MKIKEFTITMGLFDKDTHKQEIGTLDAYKICINYLMSVTDGATITEGKGIYKHDDGTVIIEPSFIISTFQSERNNLYAKKLFYLYYSKIIFLGEVGRNKQEQGELNYCKYLTCSQNDRFWKT